MNFFKKLGLKKYGKGLKSAISGKVEDQNLNDDRGHDTLLNAIIGFSGFFAAVITFFHPEQVNSVIEMLNQGKSVDQETLKNLIMNITGGSSLLLLGKIILTGIPFSIFTANIKKLLQLSKEYSLYYSHNDRTEVLVKIMNEIEKSDPELSNAIKHLEFYKKAQEDTASLKKLQNEVKEIAELSKKYRLDISEIAKKEKELEQMGVLDFLEYVRKKLKEKDVKSKTRVGLKQGI